MWEVCASQSENFRVFITPFTLSSLTLFTMSSLYVFSHSICLTLMRPKSINFGSKGTKVTASNSTKSPEKRRKITFSWNQLLLHFWEDFFRKNIGFQNYRAVISRSYFCFLNSKFITNWNWKPFFCSRFVLFKIFKYLSTKIMANLCKFVNTKSFNEYKNLLLLKIFIKITNTKKK